MKDNPAIADFIGRAREVSFDEAIDMLGLVVPARGEYQGPCPECGGKDRFGVNRQKGVWICRGCGTAGRDAISLAAHCKGWSASGYGFLETCAFLLGEQIPDGGERETEEQRAEREESRAKRQADSERTAAEKQDQSNAFREKEIMKARGIWHQAVDCNGEVPAAQDGHRAISAYMFARTGFWMPGRFFENARFRPDCGYYHGQDRGGRPLCIHSGFAMILPFVNPDGHVVGCHQTWIDLNGRAGNYRPVLWGVTKEGRVAGFTDGDRATEDAIAAGYFERLPTKKMRGTKKGALLPLCGDMDALRWVGGEGVENVMAIACAEGVRDDTFYFAAGDIGNLAGPRDPSSDFTHPELTSTDKRGRLRKVRVQGPEPAPDQTPEDALQVPEHVETLFLAADGDSERYWTAAAMARAKQRLAREWRQIDVWWPPAGQDWSGAISAAMNGDDAA